MSDAYLEERHHQLRAQVRAFAESHIAPRVADMEDTGAVETQLAEAIALQGWIGVTVDTTYGGMGAGHLAKTLIIEELSRVSGAMGAVAQASQLGVAKIIHFGNARQKQTWLPKIANGTCLPTIAVTEPDAGSHVLGMQTTARREGRHYVLNGRKIYIGNSHIGHLHGVVARTGDGSRGLTGFLVEADRPGLTLPPLVRALGLHGFSFGELHFTDCRIPVSNRLGDEGDGRDIAYSSSVLYGRPNLTAVALGIHQAILEQTTRFTSERVRYGKQLHHLPNITIKIGQMQSRLMTARLAAYHAAHLLDTRAACDTELINAKLINTELALDSARAAMEIHAAAGLLTDTPINRYLRDAHHIPAPAGTSDIQLLRLAEVALGQSKGQWSQRLSTVLSPHRTPALPVPHIPAPGPDSHPAPHTALPGPAQ
ncbi:acyl-CoA dehydrogenase family protein [Streptomyces zhihengii]|uniref:Acyl-CoA/acyl-ACP dehydrogenase n=1 Tax=Streptomyces zhihengii TaxID=1818004 RepID=A0ABS2V4J1_9ACTN|nr:acyl-CoA dehydrogenase family protein [Streptomyces zhihengii]MBM9624638.1 acyl-CoA/acyl-ACP dehydrogenase [Streptomyces zhihengii]